MAVVDEWQELCKQVALDDGLPVRDCGSWTEEKLWRWHRYISITTRAMVGNPKWVGGLAYVDLFAGPGVCRIRDAKRRLPGSPIIAAKAPKPFERLILVEYDAKLAEACKARVEAAGAGSRLSMLQGDCNELISRVVDEIPERALTLAFIDPEGLDVHFATLETLARRRQVDFLLLFADAVDLVRNVGYYAEIPDSKLDQMLGPNSRWREEWRAMANQSGANIRNIFPQIYCRQIATHLGYRGFREIPIRGPHGPLYRLIYASKHERGVDFWDKVTRKDHTGQLGLGF